MTTRLEPGTVLYVVRSRSRPKNRHPSSTSPVTLTGDFLGSLPWASPEQADGIGEQIDVRSDVYSLGVILYQLLTNGQFPYRVAGTMRAMPSACSGLSTNCTVTTARWTLRSSAS